MQWKKAAPSGVAFFWKEMMVGMGRFELPACRLGGDRSIQLSYIPTFFYLTAQTLLTPLHKIADKIEGGAWPSLKDYE